MELKYIICEAEQNGDIDLYTRDNLLSVLEEADCDNAEETSKKKNRADRAIDKYSKKYYDSRNSAVDKRNLQGTMLKAQKADLSSAKMSVDRAIEDWKKNVYAIQEKYARRMNNAGDDEARRSAIYQGYEDALNAATDKLCKKLDNISTHIDVSQVSIKKTIEDRKNSAKAARNELLSDFKAAIKNAGHAVMQSPKTVLDGVKSLGKSAVGFVKGLFHRKDKEEATEEATEIRCAIYDAEMNGTITVAERTLLLDELDKKLEEIEESTDDDESESPDFDQFYEMING